MEKREKILTAIAIAIIIARIFTAIVLPDTAYTDALYHLSIAREIVSAGELPFDSTAKALAFMDIKGDLPLPLFHVALANTFIASSVQFDFFLATFFTLVVALLQLAMIFLVCRQIFDKLFFALAAFCFAVAQPVLALFSSVNYPEAIASVLVLFSFYLVIKFDKTKNFAFLWLLPFAVASFAVAKLNATILVLVFLLAIVYYALKSKVMHAKKIAVALAVLAFLLSSFWFFAEFQRSAIKHPELDFFQKFFPSNPSEIQHLLGPSTNNVQIRESPSQFLSNPASFALEFNESFWFFLPGTVQSEVPFMGFFPVDFLRFVFFAISFPLLLACFYGLARMLVKKQKHGLLILAILAAGSIPFAVRLRSQIFLRLLLVVLPFFGILFAIWLNWLELQLKKTGFAAIQKIFWALFILVITYSLGFMASTALHYNTAFNEAIPAYDFIKTLPPDAKIAVQRHIVRSVIFFSDHNAEREFFSDYQPTNPGPQNWGFSSNLTKEKLELLLLDLKNKKNAEYVFSTCSKNPWRWDLLEILEKEARVELVFKSDCSRVYKIK